MQLWQQTLMTQVPQLPTKVTGTRVQCLTAAEQAGKQRTPCNNPAAD